MCLSKDGVLVKLNEVSPSGIKYTRESFAPLLDKQKKNFINPDGYVGEFEAPSENRGEVNEDKISHLVENIHFSNDNSAIVGDVSPHGPAGDVVKKLIENQTAIRIAPRMIIGSPAPSKEKEGDEVNVSVVQFTSFDLVSDEE